MTKILLMKPMKQFKKEEIYEVTPPLGLLYIASVLRENGPFEIKIADARLNWKSNNPSEVWKEVGAFKPNIVGISALSAEAEGMHEFAKQAKELWPGVPVIVGGPHLHKMSHITLKDTNIDAAVTGEGEKQTPILVKALLERKMNLAEIPGIAYRQDGKVIQTTPPPPIEDLDSLPMPAWDLLDMERYWAAPRHKSMYYHKQYTTLFTSRGCPFQCLYCHTIFGKIFRFHSPERVIKEIETLYNKYGVREFHFQDDAFNCKPSRAKRICDLIVEKGLKIKMAFPNGLRGDIIDEDLIVKLKAAGAYSINYACETASPRLQKLIHKNIKLDKLKTAVTQTKKAGIITMGYFMIGFPTETRKEILQTIQYAVDSDFHIASFFIVYAFEGTELYKFLGTVKISHPSSHRGEECFFNAQSGLSTLPADELRKLQRLAYRRFFLSPSRVYDFIRLLPNKHLLFKFVYYFAIRSFSFLNLRDKIQKLWDGLRTKVVQSIFGLQKSKP